MSNKKLAGILGGCIAVIVALAVIASLPPASGEADENSAFHINVIPETPKNIDGVDIFKLSIPGQHFVFLVTITDEGEESELPVSISATAPGADVVIYHEDIVEGEVAEVVVIPAPASIGTIIEVIITGNRGSASDEKGFSFEVAEGEDDRQEYAEELLDRFVAWLATNSPRLGNTERLTTAGTKGTPLWV